MPTIRKSSTAKAKAPLTFAKRSTKPRTRPDDLGKLKTIAKKLLRQFELSLKPLEEASEEAVNLQKTQHELMFGKHSQASVLVMLTDLILKIDQAKMKINSGLPVGDAASFHPDTLNDTDIALIEAFVQRMKNQPTF